MLRGGRVQRRWVTWPPVVGLRADAVGGVGREVTWLTAVGQKAERRRARVARQSASMPLSMGLPMACRWADVGGGRKLRDERAV